MTTQVTDVLDAVQSFVAKGYDREYRVKDGALVDLELGSTLDACSIRVDAALRLESGNGAEAATVSNAEDRCCQGRRSSNVVRSGNTTHSSFLFNRPVEPTYSKYDISIVDRHLRGSCRSCETV